MVLEEIGSKLVEDNFLIKPQSTGVIWLGRMINVGMVVSVITLIAGAILKNRTVIERAALALGLCLLAKCVHWYQGRDPKVEKKTDDDEKDKETTPPVSPRIETELKKENEKKTGDDSKDSTPVTTPPGTPRNEKEIKKKIEEDEVKTPPPVSKDKIDEKEKEEGDIIFDIKSFLSPSPIKGKKIEPLNESLNKTSTPTTKVIKDVKKNLDIFEELFPDSIIEDEEV